jgi:hypothetical protein
MSPSRRVDPHPSGPNPVTTGAHSRRELGSTGPTQRVPRHLKAREPRGRRELRWGRVVATSAVVAAALVAVAAFLVTSSPGGRPSKDAAAGAHRSHSPVTTTLPAVTSTTPATTTTRPAASTTTSSPPTSTTTSTTVATTTSVPAATVPPSDVLVEVLNGVGTPNVARQVARALHRLGFAINGVGNAAAFDHTRNLIEYGPNSLGAAQTVAAHVSGVPQYREYSALQANEVWVIVGATYDGVTP